MDAKYANIDANTIKNDITRAIWTALANASSRQQGIMPFVKMLQQDDTAMNINVTRDGHTVIVSNPSFDKVEIAPRYAALPGQIKAYLENNLELFPTQRNGGSVDYNNITVTLEYPNFGGSDRVATQ